MTSQLKPYSPSPMKAKTRKKKGLINIDLKKIANVDGGLQRIRDSRYKPQPINRQAARAVGIYSKKKYQKVAAPKKYKNREERLAAKRRYHHKNKDKINAKRRAKYIKKPKSKYKKCTSCGKLLEKNYKNFRYK